MGASLQPGFADLDVLSGNSGRTGPVDDDLQALQQPLVTVPLKNNYNLQYFGEVDVGDPPQRFREIFDTGSHLTWVPHKACKSYACANHTLYDEEKSNSFEGFSGAERPIVSLGDGTASVREAKDVVTVGDGNAGHGLVLRDQPFNVSSEVSTAPFRDLPVDGVAGLARAKGSLAESITGKLKSGDPHVFGFYLSDDEKKDGSFSIGGIDSGHIAADAPLKWLPASGKGPWQVKMVDLLIDGKSQGVCPSGGCDAHVGTGASFITGPDEAIEEVWKKTGQAELCDNRGPTVTIALMGKDGHVQSLNLEPKDYGVQSDDKCINGFAKNPGDTGKNSWTLGAPFLRRYYSIFDADNDRVGFVRSRHAEDAVLDPTAFFAASQPGSRPRGRAAARGRNAASSDFL